MGACIYIYVYKEAIYSDSFVFFWASEGVLVLNLLFYFDIENSNEQIIIYYYHYQLVYTFSIR